MIFKYILIFCLVSIYPYHSYSVVKVIEMSERMGRLGSRILPHHAYSRKTILPCSLTRFFPLLDRHTHDSSLRKPLTPSALLPYHQQKTQEDAKDSRKKKQFFWWGLVGTGVGLLDNEKKDSVLIPGTKEYYKSLADSGKAEDQFTYAKVCEKNGRDNEARIYFKGAADQGHVTAQLYYFVWCFNGKGGEKNLAEALKYGKLAAATGNVDACFGCASILIDMNTSEAWAEARIYFKRAADQGHKDSQLNYAVMCERGLGGKINLLEAKKNYEKVAKNGNEEAQERLENFPSLTFLDRIREKIG